MRTIVQSIFCCLFCLFTLEKGQELRAQEVLWIGNSYIGFNDLDELCMQMAWADGYRLNVTRRVIGGATMQEHSMSATTLQILQSKPWDYVVFQPNGIEAAAHPDSMLLNTLPYLNYLDSLAHVANSCVRTLLFEPWARYDGVPNAICASNPVSCSYMGAQQAIINNIALLASQTDQQIVPVGHAFKQHFEEGNTEVLWLPDSLHPTYIGSYLTAAVFYQSICNRKATLNKFKGLLSSEKASSMRALASEACAGYTLALNEKVGNVAFTIPTSSNQNEIVITRPSTVSAGSYKFIYGNDQMSNDSISINTTEEAGIQPITLYHYDTEGCLRNQNTKLFSNYETCIKPGNTSRVFIDKLEVGLFSIQSGNNFGAFASDNGPQGYVGQLLPITLSPGYHIRDSIGVSWTVWIDENNDGLFVNEERQFTTLPSITPFSEVLILPNNPGVYTLRVKSFLETDLTGKSPCANNYEGETEDYQMQVLDIICGDLVLDENNITFVTSNSALLCWPHQNGVAHYTYSYGLANQDPSSYTSVTSSQSFALMNDLEAGLTYRIRVQTACNDYASTTFTSDWLSFVVPNAVDNCNTPQDISEIPISPFVTQFVWTYLQDVSSYQCRYRPIADTTWIEAYQSESTSSILLENLQALTSYEYQIRAFCTISNTFTNYSSLDTFTTWGDAFSNLSEPLPFELGIKVYPNPGTDAIQIELISFFPQEGTWQMFDLAGRAVWQENTSEKSFSTGLSTLFVPNGTYLISFVTTEGLRSTTLWTKI